MANAEGPTGRGGGSRRFGLLFAAVVGIAAIACFASCSLERRFLFPAPPLADRTEPAIDAESERVWLGGSEARTEAVLLRGVATGKPQPLVLYTHGNGELIDYWIGDFKDLRGAGASVLLVEYPGYGRSAGTPSQESITDTLEAAYDWALSRPDIDAKRIVGYGRSLGGGAVCALSRNRQLAALILESTFTSIPDRAYEIFLVPSFLISNRFDNEAAVRAFRGPILQLHGDEDSSIPVDHAMRLHALAPGSEIHTAPCGHNDCPRPWPFVVPFLRRNALL